MQAMNKLKDEDDAAKNSFDDVKSFITTQISHLLRLHGPDSISDPKRQQRRAAKMEDKWIRPVSSVCSGESDEDSLILQRIKAILKDAFASNSGTGMAVPQQIDSVAR